MDTFNGSYSEPTEDKSQNIQLKKRDQERHNSSKMYVFHQIIPINLWNCYKFFYQIVFPMIICYLFYRLYKIQVLIGEQMIKWYYSELNRIQYEKEDQNSFIFKDIEVLRNIHQNFMENYNEELTKILDRLENRGISFHKNTKEMKIRLQTLSKKFHQMEMEFETLRNDLVNESNINETKYVRKDMRIKSSVEKRLAFHKAMYDMLVNLNLKYERVKLKIKKSRSLLSQDKDSSNNKRD
ncbi:uncharacterized protein LOC111638658 [Centruroides sculpturatus]|uniref:uncharacterized protein LOC111638658 n=1 Tax=Centruroides sculpturatus TaxID=218467 RepID=UPI000C6D34A6|nr:uncharacterized protein LOC111638658 [Centruroides sculpturatus]